MIDESRRVYVYFNLHKRCWSVRQDGKIVQHADRIMLKDCRYLVGQAGRRKVLIDRRKNVHAGVSGYLVDSVPNVPECLQEVTYNPYKHRTFVSKDNPSEPVEYSDYAFLDCGSGKRIVEAIWK